MVRLPVWRAALEFAAALGFAGTAQAVDGLEPFGTPIRSAAEVATELTAACEVAVDRGTPMLLEFSAEWCSDCRLLDRMKRVPTLAKELASWPRVVVNVGRFDQHRELLEGFGVHSIARWVVLAPTSCTSSPAGWPRQAQRTLEPDSGADKNVTPEELAVWLAGQRGALAGR